MKTLQREDGTYLTEEEMINLLDDMDNIGIPMKDYFKISELSEILLPTAIGMFEIANLVQKDDTIVFDVVFIDKVIEEKVVYPLSKTWDKKRKVSTPRFMTLLEWIALKNIDKIAEM